MSRRSVDDIEIPTKTKMAKNWNICCFSGKKTTPGWNQKPETTVGWIWESKIKSEWLILFSLFVFLQDLSEVLDFVDNFQSYIYIQMKESEGKIPDSENFEELTKLSKTFEYYRKYNEKNLRKNAKIDRKIKKILKEIDSRIGLDETKYLEWSETDVFKFVADFLEICDNCLFFRWLSKV